MFNNEFATWLHSMQAGAFWRAAAVAFCIGFGAVVLTVLVVLLLLRLGMRRRAAASPLSRQLGGKETIGFFHPYCAAGGGGERVLWCAIDAVQREHPGVHTVVYTGDANITAGEILGQAEARFGVKLQRESIHFVFLTRRHLVEAATWPRFTLLGQSLGSIGLAHEALCTFVPRILVDSMGYAFTYPLMRLAGGCQVGCYVHYPTISTDMLAMVRSRDVAVCNSAAVARSPLLSAAKLIYYRLFAVAYGFVGSFAQVVMVNSSWTRGHIDQLWGVPTGRISTVYPPCATSALAALPLRRAPGPRGGLLVVSLAQFRPEKDHPMQLRAFAHFLKEAPRRRSGGDGPAWERVRLVVAGGCRDDGDRGRLAALRELGADLGLRVRSCSSSDGAAATADDEDWDVDFRPNIPLEEVRELLGQATVGLHTMRDEHSGISVVEFMAAGALALAHDSAGPAMDIVKPLDGRPTGFLATDEASYASALVQIFTESAEERLAIAAAARRASAERFSQEAFESAFSSCMVAPFRS